MSSEPASQANDSDPSAASLKPPESGSGYGGLSPRFNPRSPATKAVTIAEPESVSPMLEASSKDVDDELVLERTPSKQQHRIKIGKRLSGRLSSERNVSSNQSLAESALSSILNEDGSHASHRGHGHGHHTHDNLITQVTAWLKQEKARRAARKAAKHPPPPESSGSSVQTKASTDSSETKADVPGESQERRSSDASEGSVALEALEHILEKTFSHASHEGRKAAHLPHRIGRKLRRQSTAGSSDTEYQDGDVLVPSCDAILDNSRTLAYSGGTPDPDVDDMTPGTKKAKEKQAWATFKYEIVRLSHTLRLKGWRRVPMDRSSDIEVERLSGALTNAVYVVSPPKDLPPKDGEHEGEVRPRIPPPKLLLRIYGPQVEHLIDRESELQILRRLARKRIGPRLLGTFANGRFEEYFHARALTPKDLRNAETSVQIAKRMRELHEGIDLLPQEREDGPFVWRNWDKWVDRCEQITKWADAQILEAQSSGTDPTKVEAWKQRGFVCCVPWEIFRQTVEKYRKWLEEQYGGRGQVNNKLVFAHNDTQYGNILRLVPPGDSPLLLPANEHKQLIVIDFEYANANTPGLEFANHFTEWCYNYHDPNVPHAINTAAYPTPAEQRRFIRSYISHRPFQPSYPSSGNNPSATPNSARPTIVGHSSSISNFMLDSRAPPQQIHEQEEREEREIEKEIQRLMAETQLWRLANSVQWVAWGIVQAKIPGLPAFNGKEAAATTDAGDEEATTQEEEQSYMNPAPGEATDPLSPEAEAMAEDLADKRPDEVSDGGESAEEEEFDYLAYAQERALFFWGDAVRLGIVKAEDLPEELRHSMKVVEY